MNIFEEIKRRNSPGKLLDINYQTIYDLRDDVEWLIGYCTILEDRLRVMHKKYEDRYKVLLELQVHNSKNHD